MTGNSRLDRLIRLRDTLERAIDECESKRDLAALSRQYRETMKEIEEIEGAETDGDEITELLSSRESARKPGSVL